MRRFLYIIPEGDKAALAAAMILREEAHGRIIIMPLDEFDAFVDPERMQIITLGESDDAKTTGVDRAQDCGD